MSGVVSQNPPQQVHHLHQWRTDINKSTCARKIKPQRYTEKGAAVPRKMYYISTVLVYIVLISGVSGAAVSGGSRGNGGGPARGNICHMAGCNCSAKAVVWTVVNCTLLEYQDMQVLPRTIPDDLIELQINAAGTGSRVTVHGNAFLGLRGFNRLLIDGAHALRLRTHAVHNLTTPSVLIQVRRCDIVWVERAAIKNIETSVIIEINDSEVVTIEGSAFSRLHEARFTDIADLQLHKEAFTFEHMRTSRHGPATIVSFHNVAIPQLPAACFSSALAEIQFRDSRISDIDSESFKAKVISSISIFNSSIGRLRSRALIDDLHVVSLHMAKSHVHVIESGAIVAAFTNFKIEHSRLDMLQADAISTPVAAHIDLLDNEFRTLTPNSLTFRNWNRIRINHNIIKNLHTNFLNILETTTAEEFTFIANEIYNLDDNSLRFVADLKHLTTAASVTVFDNNFFNQTCHCDIGAWLARVVNSTDVDFIVNSSFCSVDALLSNCFELPEGLINMRNFTELVCGPESYIKCEPYNGETKVLDTTAIMLLDDISPSNSSRFVLYLTLSCLFIVAIIATVIILLVRGAIWLDHKGYCDRFKLQYSTDHHANNEEDNDEDNGQNRAIIIDQREFNDDNTETPTTEETSSHVDVVIDDDNNHNFPEELTLELLQSLREKLEDPATHEEAREKIEKLYEMFVVEDSYTNNNRMAQRQHQIDDAHLYEELGLNLNNQVNNNLKDPQRSKENEFSNNLLKLIEEILPDEKTDKSAILLPKLVNEYSEPSDAEFHVYSELKPNTINKNEDAAKLKTHSNSKDSLKSSGTGTGSSSVSGSSSGKMAFRPLPAKPTDGASAETKTVVDQQRAGTSTQQYKF